MLNILDNLNDAFDKMFGSESNELSQPRPIFANQHQQNVFEHLQNTGWEEMDKFSMHFERKDKPGIIVFCGDDVFILEKVLDVPWARVNTIHQMENDLNSLS